MLYLSLSALKYAIDICEEFPGYKIGIALSDISDSKSIIDILSANIKHTGARVIVSRNDSRIEFRNGSYIRIMSGSDNQRGYRCNLFIVDHNIDREIINCVFLPCERLDYYKTHKDGIV